MDTPRDFSSPPSAIYPPNLTTLDAERSEIQAQSAVAERAGVTVRYVQAVEAGDYNPTFSTLLALARGLEVAPVELFVPPMSTEPAPRGRPPGVKPSGVTG
jgi:transcriptional regulator with XRE-family HTH domain